MKYFKILLLTATLFMNASFGADELELSGADCVSLADTLYKGGGFIGAIGCYQTALEMPGLTESDRANCQQKLEDALNQLDIADTNYHIERLNNQLVRLSGEAKATCLSDLARLHCKVRNYAAAIDHLTSALDMPELVGEARAKYRASLGLVYFYQKNFVKAISHFNKALTKTKLDGRNRAHCLVALGVALYKEGNFVDAKKQLTSALDMPELVGTVKAACLNAFAKNWLAQTASCRESK